MLYFLERFSNNIQIYNLMKIRPVEDELLYVDRQTGGKQTDRGADGRTGRQKDRQT